MSFQPSGTTANLRSCTACGMPTDGRSCSNPQCNQYLGAGWSTTSSSPSNDNYLGSRLLYGSVEDKLSGIVTTDMIFAFFKKAIMWWLISLPVGFFFGFVLGFLGQRPGLALTITTLVFIASFIVFFITFREPISGWKFVLDGKSGAADSAFAQIQTALLRRKSPVEAKLVRITGSSDQNQRKYLQIRHRQFSAYISVFPIGRDLFLGWTIWLEMSPLRMIWQFMFLQTRLSYFQLVVRSDEAQAFREIVHNATREGVDIANLGIEVPAPTTFGSEITEQAEIG